MIKALILAVLAAAQAPALSEDEEARAQDIMREVRCMVCSGESILDSGAPMAGDMRHQVRTRIAEDEEPEAIRAWLVERYGDYVSYAPVVSKTTWPLFAIPLLLLAGAGAILWRRLRRVR